MRLLGRQPSADKVQAAEKAFERLKSRVEGARRTVLFDQEHGLYQRWYFEFRLKEEVARSTRYGTPFALLVVAIAGDAEGLERKALIKLAAQAIPRTVRSVDLVGLLGDEMFGICLLNCARKEAQKAAARLDKALDAIPHLAAGVFFPDDNLTDEELLAFAINRLQGSSSHAPNYAAPVLPIWPKG